MRYRDSASARAATCVCAPADATVAARMNVGVTTDANTFTLFPLLSLRHARREIVQRLLLLQHLDAEVVLHAAEADVDLPQIGETLRVEVGDDLRDSQRQLALLAPLALLDERSDLAQQLRVGRRGPRNGRRCRRLRLAHFGAQPLLKREQLVA